jgi:hypothetical protein
MAATRPLEVMTGQIGSVASESALTTVRDVKEAILVLVLSIDIRHGYGCFVERMRMRVSNEGRNDSDGRFQSGRRTRRW